MKPLPDCLIFLLAKAYQRAHSQFRKDLEPYGLTNIQHVVLEGIWHEQGQTSAELGKLLVLDKATLSGVLSRMQDGGWIEKLPDADDRRVVRIFTTEKTAELKGKLIALRTRANEKLLEPFSLEERVLLKRLLADLADVDMAR